jgi:hypothetical protein
VQVILAQRWLLVAGEGGLAVVCHVRLIGSAPLTAEILIGALVC